jgi:hypothetical protein
MCVQSQKGWLHQLAELVPEPQVLFFPRFFVLFCSFLKARKGWIHQLDDLLPGLFFLPLNLFFFLKVVAGGHENVF